ncbi:MAG: paraquat-inducible protein A [Bdellovibrionales bacterium]|nr:paraquat-inducible protein A [Bdellovibrionales bacterium]
METRLTDNSFYLCDQCHQPIAYDNSLEQGLHCDRCGHHIDRWYGKSTRHTLVFSLTALVLYIPALMFPFMTVELNGNRTSSTIWQGVVSLSESGSWIIAIIVLLASIVIPFVKLILLFYLTITRSTERNARAKTQIFRFIESIGRWSMLDIFLLSVLVAIMKINPWTYVRPELGSLMFAFVVIFTMMASASFDPRLIWKDIPSERK